MADERLDRIEEKLDNEILASATFRGELRQFMVNSDSFVKAVSAKTSAVDRDLQDHKSDNDAHGAGVKREFDGKLIGWATVGATLIASFGGVIGGAIHKFWSSK